ncbi:degenerin unc-8-like [Dermacentor silvarum]|uniref:degenerin unc-8-like n=1 Tax=Dermacentor silvarum TaxID=543639 RepID=UPI00210131B7|nr:degenerin unc-8-like [Dermacentor silvarum]
MKGTDSGAERGHDNDAPSHSVWRACGEVYGQLARDSGLPGADVFVEGGRVRRLLWTAAVLTLVYYSASETGAILREYFTYSVAVAFEYNTNESFELPDVTVCNVNQLRRSKLCALEASERAMESELEERLCGKSQEFREANTDDLKLQHRLSDWLALTAVRNASQVETLGHQFTDVVIDCTYHEKDCKQARFFLNHTNPWYGNCFCIHCEKTDRLFDYNSLASPYNGLVMTLNPELHEYLPTSYQAGFLVMIHAHGTRTWPKCLRELLEEPYGAYTREDCLNLCLQQMVVERCGCLTAQLPQLNKLATMYGACGENEYECVAQVSADATNMQLENRCQCHSACL